MKRFKKQFLAASLVLALGAAVYLNWTLSASPKAVSKTLGESKFVNATVANVEDKKSDTKPTDAKETSAVLNDKQKAFFAKAKSERQKTQDRIIDTAAETIKSDSTSEKEQNEAQLQVAGMLKSFTMQDTVETNLKAKGFTEALCYITDSGCTVNVLKKELTDDTAMIVKATVKSVCNIGFDKITIVTV